MLSVGALAPPFDVTDTEGKRLELGALLGTGPVILAFFPMAFTPG